MADGWTRTHSRGTQYQKSGTRGCADAGGRLETDKGRLGHASKNNKIRITSMGPRTRGNSRRVHKLRSRQRNLAKLEAARSPSAAFQRHFPPCGRGEYCHAASRRFSRPMQRLVGRAAFTRPPICSSGTSVHQPLPAHALDGHSRTPEGQRYQLAARVHAHPRVLIGHSEESATAHFANRISVALHTRTTQLNNAVHILAHG